MTLPYDRSVRRLLPEPAIELSATACVDADPRPDPGDRPWLAINMVTSIDGAIAVEGRSGGLGTAGDREMFHALRAMPDAIVAGAGTVRDEDYGPVVLSDDERARRLAAGRAELPRLVVVTGRLDLDPRARLFSDPRQRPLVLTARSAPAERRAAVGEVAEIIDCGDERVDVTVAMRELRSRGIAIALCEGGPTLNAQLAAANLIDEWCATTSPLLVAGTADRAARGPARVGVTRLALARVCVDDDGAILTRHARPGSF
jgi:riboflavin-specific deaminase-like protein